MARTVFVNPAMFENPRRRRKGRKSRKSRKSRRHSYGRRNRRKATYRGTITMRRNAGIAPFLQNPLILSNPRPKRRRRRSNPLALPSMKGLFENLLSQTGGAAMALTVNTLGTNRIDNAWLRRGVQAGTAAVGGAMISKKSATLGGAFSGAMLYPFLQDLAADLLGIGVGAGVVAAKEADIDALAADLEDVLDDMGDSDSVDFGDDDDDEEYVW